MDYVIVGIEAVIVAIVLVASLRNTKIAYNIRLWSFLIMGPLIVWIFYRHHKQENGENLIYNGLFVIGGCIVVIIYFHVLAELFLFKHSILLNTTISIIYFFAFICLSGIAGLIAKIHPVDKDISGYRSFWRAKSAHSRRVSRETVTRTIQEDEITIRVVPLQTYNVLTDISYFVKTEPDKTFKDIRNDIYNVFLQKNQLKSHHLKNTQFLIGSEKQEVPIGKTLDSLQTKYGSDTGFTIYADLTLNPIIVTIKDQQNQLNELSLENQLYAVTSIKYLKNLTKTEFGNHNNVDITKIRKVFNSRQPKKPLSNDVFLRSLDETGELTFIMLFDWKHK